MGGRRRRRFAQCAIAVIAEWARCENFTLYDDVSPASNACAPPASRSPSSPTPTATLSRCSSTSTWRRFVDAAVTSFEVGELKPSPKIFHAALDAVGARAAEAVMVGDSYEDDVHGALALGIAGAILLDRAGGSCSRFRRSAASPSAAALGL